MGGGGKLAIAAVVFLCSLQAAHSGVFEDNDLVAREQIKGVQAEVVELRDQTVTRLNRVEAAMRMQIDLANQIEGLRVDLAKLRGQLEVASHDIENSQKRQRDFYIDLDGRLRKLEGAFADIALKTAEPTPTPVELKVDPNLDTRVYEDALNLFKAKKYKEAQLAFEAFLKDYPGSTLVSSAQFWLGNTYYAQLDCKRTVDAHNLLVSRYPDSGKVPDSLLAIATCQQELKDSKGARDTLRTLVAKYPDTAAAGVARKRLNR